jgi:toxin FitB
VTGWLLDTNVLLELYRLDVSVVTFAEIRVGIEMVTDAARRAELNHWLEHKVRPMFEQRVLAISEDVMFKWRLLVDEAREARHTFSQPDIIIAATALDQGLPVVSRDVSEYRKARVPVLNPWRD